MSQSSDPSVSPGLSNQVVLHKQFDELIANLRTNFHLYRGLEDQRGFRHQLYQRHGDFGKSLMNLAVVYEETEKKVLVSYEAKTRKRAHELGLDNSGDLVEVEKRIQEEMIRRTNHAGNC